MSHPNPPAATTAFAIGLILATGVLLSGMDTAGKFLSSSGVPVLMVIWGRYFFHTVLTFASYAGRTRSLGFLRTRRPAFQFLRAVALFGTTCALYVAITLMPLADATSIQFLAPVLVTALSGLVLGERVGPRRWAAVGAAFVGVLLIARPGSGALGWTALLPLASAVMLAVYMMMTRIVRDSDAPAATTFYSTAVGAAVLSVAVPFVWADLSAFQWLLMAVMGGAGAGGHFLLVKAFHAAEASVLAPFTYAHVAAAMVWGYVVFGDVPGGWMLSGAGLIVAGGLYVWYRERHAH